MPDAIVAAAKLGLRNGDCIGDGIHPDRFTIHQRLGRGAYGKVYKAQDNLYERPVALKFILLGTEQEERNLALHEAKALARIRHPNVVPVFEMVQAGAAADEQRLPPFLVMEYVEGQELHAVLKDQKEGMPPGKAIHIMQQVAAALVACHRAGVLHRDLKPANIMIGDDGVVKLIDFGVAHRELHAETAMLPYYLGSLRGRRSEDTGGGSPTTGKIRPNGKSDPSEGSSGTGPPSQDNVGTPYYIAPEIWAGEAGGVPTDIFAFGVTFFKALTGKYPVPAEDLEGLKERMQSGVGWNKLEDLRSGLSPLLQKVVMRCLERDEGLRYQSAENLLKKIEEANRLGAKESSVGTPFVGLKAFTPDHRGVFFGREEEVARLVHRLARVPVLTLVGESGAGKSSLAMAGLYPAVEEGQLDDETNWTLTRIAPGKCPVERLSSAVAAFLQKDAQQIAKSITEDPDRWPLMLTAGKRPRQARRKQILKQRGLILLVDQLEELVTLCDDPEQQEVFGRAIGAVADSRARVKLLLTVRSDYLVRLAGVPGLVSAMEVVHLVRPLDGEALRAAVVSPVLSSDYRFEDEAMVETILGELAGRSGAMPLVQFALLRLWEHRDRKRKVIPVAELERLGSIGAALAEWAEEQFQVLSQEWLADEVRAVLLALISTEGTKQPRSLKEIIGALCPKMRVENVSNVVARLREAGLLTGGDMTIELAHEALTREWKRLNQWIEESRELRELATEVEHDAQRWISRGKAGEVLWRGDRLEEARALLDMSGFIPLTLASVDFITESNLSWQGQKWRRRMAAGLLCLVIMVIALGFIRSVISERDMATKLTKTQDVMYKNIEKALHAERLRGRAMAQQAEEAKRHRQKEQQLLSDLQKAEDRLTQTSIVKRLIYKRPSSLAAPRIKEGPERNGLTTGSASGQVGFPAGAVESARNPLVHLLPDVKWNNKVEVCLFAPSTSLSSYGDTRNITPVKKKLKERGYLVSCIWPYMRTSPRFRQAVKVGVVQHSREMPQEQVGKIVNTLKNLYPKIVVKVVPKSKLFRDFDILIPEKGIQAVSPTNVTNESKHGAPRAIKKQ